jgi:hypothetical protein
MGSCDGSLNCSCRYTSCISIGMMSLLVCVSQGDGNYLLVLFSPLQLSNKHTWHTRNRKKIEEDMTSCTSEKWKSLGRKHLVFHEEKTIISCTFLSFTSKQQSYMTYAKWKICEDAITSYTIGKWQSFERKELVFHEEKTTIFLNFSFPYNSAIIIHDVLQIGKIVRKI